MKNLTFCILLLSFTAWGQEQGGKLRGDTSPTTSSDTSVKLQRTISLETDSKVEEVLLNVEENVDRIVLVINSTVTGGKLKIEVYDGMNSLPTLGK